MHTARDWPIVAVLRVPGHSMLVVGGYSSSLLTAVELAVLCKLFSFLYRIHSHWLLDAYLWASAVSHASTRLVNFVCVIVELVDNIFCRKSHHHTTVRQPHSSPHHSVTASLITTSQCNSLTHHHATH